MAYEDGALNSSFHTIKLERIPFECRKTKIKVITLANHNGQRQSREPIKARSNYTYPTQSVEKKFAWVKIGFGFTSDWLKKWRKIFKPVNEHTERKAIAIAYYFRHSTENRSSSDKVHF